MSKNLIRGYLVFFLSCLYTCNTFGAALLQESMYESVIQNTIVFPLQNSNSLTKLVISATSRFGLFFSRTECLKGCFAQNHSPIFSLGSDYCLCSLCESLNRDDFYERQWDQHSQEIVIHRQ